jgi:UDP-glucose 4-epimerase
MAILAGQQPTIYGDGGQSRDFTFVKNIVHGNLLASEADGVGGQVINVADGRQTTLLQLLEILQEMLGKRVTPDFQPVRAGDVRESLADISKARRLLGYDPQSTLRQGLEQTIDYYRQYAERELAKAK